MHLRIFFTALCLTNALHAQQPATEPQSWTSSDGRAIQAKFIKLDGDSVGVAASARLR